MAIKQAVVPPSLRVDLVPAKIESDWLQLTCDRAYIPRCCVAQRAGIKGSRERCFLYLSAEDLPHHQVFPLLDLSAGEVVILNFYKTSFTLPIDKGAFGPQG